MCVPWFVSLEKDTQFGIMIAAIVMAVAARKTIRAPLKTMLLVNMPV